MQVARNLSCKINISIVFSRKNHMRNRIENENCSFYLWYANLKYIGIVILSEHLRLYCYQKV